MKKILLSLFTILCVLATANAETYTHTFKSGELTTNGGTITLSDIEWNASGATYIDWSTTKGIQIGSKNNPNTSYELGTSAFAGYKIKSVTVNSSIAASGDAKITITVGSQTSAAYAPKTSDAAYTFDCEDTNGDITINGSKFTFNGVIYAPNGKITINAKEINLTGGVYGEQIEINGTCQYNTALMIGVISAYFSSARC